MVDMPAWSPDGQWIAYVRQEGVKTQLVKLKPQTDASPIPLSESAQVFSVAARTDWSPKGDWILFVGTKPGLTLISSDGKSQRSLTSRTPFVYGFSKDGAQVYAVVHNTETSLREWQLFSFDVATGAEKVLGAVDLPPSVSFISGYSMHPDGKRFLFSAATNKLHVWMLEGFEQRTSFLDRVLSRY
jgi:Tol biopolymer transport system component